MKTIDTQINEGSKTGAGALNPRLFKNNVPKIGILSRIFGRPVKIAHQRIIWRSSGTFRVTSTYAVIRRLTNQLSESLSTPAKNPIIVAVIIPRLDTRTVLRSPTTSALPNDDCEVYSISRWLISKNA